VAGLAVLAALVDAALAASLPADSSTPRIALAFTVAVVAAGGPGLGFVAAIVAGLTVDSVTFRPLGSTAAELIAVAGVMALLTSRLNGRARAAAVLAVVPLSVCMRLIEWIAGGGRLAASLFPVYALQGVGLDLAIGLLLVAPALLGRSTNSRVTAEQ
jgi:cell shape-determining protein MreD